MLRRAVGVFAGLLRRDVRRGLTDMGWLPFHRNNAVQGQVASGAIATLIVARLHAKRQRPPGRIYGIFKLVSQSVTPNKKER